MRMRLERNRQSPQPHVGKRRSIPPVRPGSLNLRAYFETAIGSGYLATASSDGTVNLALYDRPIVLAEDLVVFAMKHRLTLENVRENRHAAYAFHEPGPRRGLRLYLERVREEDGGELLTKFRRRAEWVADGQEAEELATLVYFRVTALRPLVVR